MDINKNSYTIVFSAIMVIIVAAVLSSWTIWLKPFQKINIEMEKKQNILQSIGIELSREESAQEYDFYIKEEILLNNKGQIIEGSAFDLNLEKEIKKEIHKQKLPLYIAEVHGEDKYIIPLRGKGLWGPIWGFIALEDDFNTISAAVFDHEKETPGLGAEINTSNFQESFSNKKIFANSELVSITLYKGGAPEGDMHGANAISGGTITSDGVEDMIQERLEMYLPYLKTMYKKMEVSYKHSLFDNDTSSNIGSRKID